jgi:hypothetical protein
MKQFRSFLVISLAFFALACSDVRESSEVPVSSNDKATANNLQQCLDSKMEQWYKAFNQYQLEGYNMFAADLKALQEANAVYENCRAQNQAVVRAEASLK